MNEQQVFNAVMIAADARERLARTWPPRCCYSAGLNRS